MHSFITVILVSVIDQNPSAAIDLPLTQNWSYFRGATNISSPEASGAYVFRYVLVMRSRRY